MSALDAVETWPVPTVAAGWRRADDEPTSIGPVDHLFPLASVTKPLVALAVLVAIEEGSLAFDHPAGPPDATVAHLLSHSSGLAPEEGGPTTGRVGSRRIYSNHGYEEVGRVLEQATGLTMADYLAEAICMPLGMTSTGLQGSPGHSAVSSVTDLLALGAELLRPTLISQETLAAATTPHLPELSGVLPGFGRQDPNPWGQGFEIRGEKQPHWTGADNSERTYGHFGRAGTFIWLDPDAEVFCVALTDRDFGPWAAKVWPLFSDQVLAEAGASVG